MFTTPQSIFHYLDYRDTFKTDFNSTTRETLSLYHQLLTTHLPLGYCALEPMTGFISRLSECETEGNGIRLEVLILNLSQMTNYKLNIVCVYLEQFGQNIFILFT